MIEDSNSRKRSASSRSKDVASRGRVHLSDEELHSLAESRQSGAGSQTNTADDRTAEAQNHVGTIGPPFELLRSHRILHCSADSRCLLLLYAPAEGSVGGPDRTRSSGGESEKSRESCLIICETEKSSLAEWPNYLSSVIRTFVGSSSLQITVPYSGN